MIKEKRNFLMFLYTYTYIYRRYEYPFILNNKYITLPLSSNLSICCRPNTCLFDFFCKSLISLLDFPKERTIMNFPSFSVD
jgi:hypothetical protein